MSRAKKKDSRTPGFEESLRRLEGIVASLEEGDLSLEESLRLFEEGVHLTRSCTAKLDEAQRRIDVLTKGEKGELNLTPFAPTPDPEDTPAGSGGGAENR